jgi:hypothetical protein
MPLDPIWLGSIGLLDGGLGVTVLVGDGWKTWEHATEATTLFANIRVCSHAIA